MGHAQRPDTRTAASGDGDPGDAGAQAPPVAQDCRDGGLRVHPRVGQAVVLRRQRTPGAGPGVDVQAAVYRLPVRGAQQTAVDAGGGGQRGLLPSERRVR